MFLTDKIARFFELQYIKKGLRSYVTERYPGKSISVSLYLAFYLFYLSEMAVSQSDCRIL